MSRNATTAAVERTMYAEPIGCLRIGGSEAGGVPAAIPQNGHGIVEIRLCCWRLKRLPEDILLRCIRNKRSQQRYIFNVEELRISDLLVRLYWNPR